ncbi:MAG: sulfotransferase [Halieaceae bacterium]|jgi:hypothetical protein|nr:sulfotransferase [Halieaceae bacterium]
MANDLKPDFVIIGAMKCGTTTLAAQLGAQDGIFITEPKEPAFFSHDEIFARGEDWYRSLYEPAQAGDIRGEASTEYSKLPTYPHAVDRLHAFAPDARLIYITRDPYARIVSHYMHLWRDGTVPRDINRAVREHPEFIAYSKYEAQLQPWIERFGDDAVLSLSMEDMAANPQAILERAARHIGYSADVHWRDDLDRMNPGVGHIRSFPLKRVLVDNPLMETLRRRLVPKGARLRIRQLLGLELTRKPMLSDDTRAFIAAELEKPLHH